jgi:hypothetical protein
MLNTVALVTVLGLTTLVVRVLAWLADGLDRRRHGRIVAQVRVTDAIHGVLGAIVAPTVTGAVGNRWIVTMGIGPRERATAGRLSEIAREVLGQDGTGVEVVFTPRG